MKKQLAVLSILLLLVIGVGMSGMAAKSQFIDGNLYVLGTSTFVGTVTLDGLTLGGDLVTDRWEDDDSNTFIGVDVCGADALTTGLDNNTAFGYQAMYSVTTADYTVGIGSRALYSLESGSYNIAVGFDAGFSLTTGHSNVAVGQKALKLATTQNSNVAVGMSALENTIHSFNTAVGASAMKTNTSGFQNTAFGYKALFGNTTGENNIGVGYDAGGNITTGTYNIVIGFDTDVPSATTDGQIVIGDNTNQGQLLGDATGDMTLKSLSGKEVHLAVADVDVLDIRGAAAANTATTFVEVIGTTAAHGTLTGTDIFFKITPTIGIPTGTAVDTNLIDLSFTSPVWTTAVTSNLRAIYIAPTIGAADDGTNQVNMIEIENYTGDAQVNVTGIAIGTSDGLGTANAVTIDEDWDLALDAAAGITIADDSQLDLLIYNETTGSDQNSGWLTLRGYDHDTTTAFDMAMMTVVTTSTDYRLSFLPTGHGTEIASLDQGGDFQMDGDLDVDGGEIDVTVGATDLVIAAATATAFEVYDGTTALLGFDTVITGVSGTETITLNPGPVTVPDDAASTRNGVVIKTASTSAAATTGITTPFDGLSFKVEAPELIGFGAGTIVTQASTMYIEGAPTAGADMTISTGYALEVEAGTTFLGGYLEFDGAQDILVDADTASVLDFSVATTPFLTFNTQNTTDNISNFTFTGIPASYASGAGNTKRTVTITPGTTTLDTVTGTDNMSGMGLYVDQPTIDNDDIGTVAIASTVYIVGEPVIANAALITAPYALEIASGDFLTAGGIDVDGVSNLDAVDIDDAVTLTNGEILNNAADGVVTFTGDDETGIDFQIISMAHDTTGDASLTLDADVGGDDDDTWILRSVASGNAFNIIQHATTEFSIDTAGNATTTGDITVSGGDVIDGSGGGVAVTNKGTSVETLGGVQKTVITFTLMGDHDIDTADGGKSTGVQVYDFPDGYIQIIGALIDCEVITNAAYNADVADQYFISVGTVDGTQAADADLTGTEADVIAKTTHDTDSAGANSQLTNQWETQTVVSAAHDGTGTAINLFVNVAVPDANNTTATTHDVQGTLTILWTNYGDY